MSGRALDALLGGAVRTRAQGHRGWTLRLLSAQETLEARREAAELAADQREWALCANACLLARALERSETRQPVFASGQEVPGPWSGAENLFLDPGRRFWPVCRRRRSPRWRSSGRSSTGRKIRPPRIRRNGWTR